MFVATFVTLVSNSTLTERKKVNIGGQDEIRMEIAYVVKS